MARPDQSFQIECEVCGHSCKAAQKGRNICRPCLKKEPSVPCTRCSLTTRHADSETGQCPRCTRVTSRKEGVCAHCSRTRIIFNREAQLCETCHKVVRKTKRYWEKQARVTCTVCGQLRVSALYRRDICISCWNAEKNGYHHCSMCGKLKLIYAKADNLCMQCHDRSLAPGALRKYISNFSTPYPYNNILFDFLAAAIEWDSVNKNTERKFHTFGRFLQERPLAKPLTWEAIEALFPPLGATNRTGPKMIRACLLELGHLLASRGELEGRETYIQRRNALLPIGQAPLPMQALMRRYAEWLWERRSVPTSVRDHMEVLASFWSWCELRDVRAPEEVQEALINDYLLHLYWQWLCSSCQSSTAFDPRERNAPRKCAHCGTIGSLVKEKRYAQNTVRGHRAKLFVFFDWLKLNRMVISNPVRRKIPPPAPTIRHYSLNVVKQLCEYMRSPDADPIEALFLYLVTFHALTVWELRHVMLPTLLPLRPEIPVPGLAEAYYVIVPRPEPSLGDRSPGRPDTRLDFPNSAASWLKPLLSRFESQRLLMAPDPSNRYLLISPLTRRRNTPVGHFCAWDIICRASTRVLSATCNPATLRKTAGVMLADRAGADILRWMGWEDQQAFAYAWAPREEVQPRSQEEVQDPALSNPNSILFPSPKESLHHAALKRTTSTDR